MNLYYSPTYITQQLAFDTTRKAGWIAAHLAQQPIPGVKLVAPAPLSPAEVMQVHAPEYVDAVRTGHSELARSSGLGWSADTFQAVCASNGGAVAAMRTALATGRPSGSLSSGMHHARYERGAGFCVFNGLALMARAARGARVLILDFDAHGGGGTYSLVKHWPQVTQIDVLVSASDADYVPSWPSTCVLVTDAFEYLATIERCLEALDRAHLRFDVVLYNAGMDPMEHSAIGGLAGITPAVLAARETLVFGWARARGEPVAFVLAGGYTGPNLSAAELVSLHCLTLTAGAPEDELHENAAPPLI